MKYFLTLLGVAAFVVLVFAFDGKLFENNVEVERYVGVGISKVFTERDKGNGEVVDQTREVEDFTAVSSSNAIKVELKKGNENKVVVRTDSNLQDFLITESDGTTLTVYVNGILKKYTELTVYITYKELDCLESASASKIICEDLITTDRFRISASSASKIRLDNLKAKEISVETSSAANVKIAGECESLEVDASSASDGDLYDLKAENVEVDASSAADVHVHVIKNLEADASSGADIVYKGNPQDVDIDESSRGKVSQY